MSHDHASHAAGHGHGHAHGHAHGHDTAAATPTTAGPSVLMLGAGTRLAAALAAIALLWAAVAWALTDLAA